jgi:diguanylate cyclase (GGDEF)-like protein
MFMRAKDGNDVLIRNTLAPLKDGEGRIQRVVSLFVPLADGDYEHGLVKQIYEVATRDPTTCLPGRKYMESCIDDALELYHRTGRQFAILFVDVDNLHYLNNNYGHVVGDKVLRAFALALRKYGRKTDDFCRWGGDEFVGILRLRSAEDVKGASRRFARIAKKGRVSEGGQEIDCQVSMGMTVVRDEDDLKSVVARADRYMYEAKRHHANRIVTDFDAGVFGQED